MNDIIKAVRVLAEELQKQISNDHEMETISALNCVLFALDSAADRLERESKEQVSDDGWITWSGGEQPVISESVEIKYRCGDIGSSQNPSEYEWGHFSHDIIAYRVLKP